MDGVNSTSPALTRLHKAAKEQKMSKMGNSHMGPFPSGAKVDKARGNPKTVTKKKSGSTGEKVDMSGKGTKGSK